MNQNKEILTSCWALFLIICLSTSLAAQTCDPLSVEAVADGVVCPGDPFTLGATLNEVVSGAFS